MDITRFTQFLKVARDYTELIVDICSEIDELSYAQLLHYMEHHAIPVNQKEQIIELMCKADILVSEQDRMYSVNSFVVELVNYYTRRGRLISATFLREQVELISVQTEKFQRTLFSKEPQRDEILDVIDDLYLLVRQVREAGEEHYFACMRLLGDIKRGGGHYSIDRRLSELETAQRRYIEPLRELIEPSGEYVKSVTKLRQLVHRLGQMSDLNLQSQELDSHRRRLGKDLLFIDQTLLYHFAIIVDTARKLLRSLMEEKSLKDALAFCLANLPVVWRETEGTTILSAGRNISQAPPLDRMEYFFTQIAHRQLLPNPRPLAIRQPARSHADDIVLTEERVWRELAHIRESASWPHFVIEVFPGYSDDEILRAIMLPLLRRHPRVQIFLHGTQICCNLTSHILHMRNFGVQWRDI